VCHRLYLASPLTLSEIRAMLPDGITADLLQPSLHRFFTSQLHGTRTGVQLRHGGCACDLAGRRHPEPLEDERNLRAHYRQIRAPREGVIRALEWHRRRPAGPPTGPGHWAAATAAFVAEHARNAGPALYYLDFTPEAERQPPWPEPPPRSVTAAQVREAPADWLLAGDPTIVQP
jgi:hypothetical protein